MSSFTFTPKELAVFVELVAGFNPGEGELRTLVSVARFAASSQDSDRTGAALGILDTPMTPEAVQSFRTRFAQAQAAERVNIARKPLSVPCNDKSLIDFWSQQAKFWFRVFAGLKINCPNDLKYLRHIIGTRPWLPLLL